MIPGPVQRSGAFGRRERCGLRERSSEVTAVIDEVEHGDATAVVGDATGQPVDVELGNVYNSTYTGIYDITMKITYYMADAQNPPAQVAGEVLRVEWPLRGDAYWRLLVHFGSHAAYTTPRSGITVYSTGVQPAATPQVRLEPGAVIVDYTE